MASATVVATPAPDVRGTGGDGGFTGKPTPAVEPLTLYPYQRQHADVLRSILAWSPFALDLSMLGTGKTYTAAQLAADLGLNHIVAIAPTSVKLKWQQLQERHGIPLTECISYCGLRATKCRQPTHGLLVRRDYTREFWRGRTPWHPGVRQSVDCAEFVPSDKLRALVEGGVLLVIDEVQNIKNVTHQFHACRALIREIVDHWERDPASARSRVLLLSGSPIDQEEHAAHLFRCLGVMRSDEMCQYEVHAYRYVYTGMQDILDYCRRIAPRDPDVRAEPRGGATACCHRAYALFQRVFKPRLSHAMQPPVNDASGDGVLLRPFDGYYRVERAEDRALLEAGVRRLANASSFDPALGTVDFAAAQVAAAEAISGVTLALMQIETAKLHTFERLARAALAADTGAKVVVCLNFTATLKDLTGMLADLNPLVLNGSMSVRRRADAVRRFQQPSAERRVLLSNLMVCSTGIDLDDKYGAFPRTVLISPTYSTITLYQLCHRFRRMDTRSSTEIRMVYGRDADEMRILRALARKSSVMKETTQEQAQCGVLFPGDFPRLDEAVEEQET